eukprot:scaffold26884_cov39-Cyclotella_meneghiniana.AAC.1
MRHWDSPAAMVWMKSSIWTLTQLRTVGDTTELFTHSALKIEPVETLAGKAFQSRPHNIIQHIHNETLGQSSSYGLDKKLPKDTDLDFFSIRATTELFTLPSLKIQPVKTLAGKAFQSRPHNIIQHIHNETLGQSSSYGLDEKPPTETELDFFSIRATTELFTLSRHSKSSPWRLLLAKHSNQNA